MKNNMYTDFVAKPDAQYNSIIDEYRRIKYFMYKKKFSIAEKDIAFELLIRCLKHMFKVKRSFVVGIEFGLNVKNTYTKYRVSELNYEEKYIILEWNVDNDEYLLEFRLSKFGSAKSTKIIFKQRIFREKTFFGMADYIGIVIYKKAFKSNMKAFCGYINHLIENGEVDLIKKQLEVDRTQSETK